MSTEPATLPGGFKLPEAWLRLSDEEFGLAVREFKRELCKRDLFYLTTEVLGYKQLSESLHRPLCMVVQAVNPIIEAKPEAKARTKFPFNLALIPAHMREFYYLDSSSKTRLFMMFRSSFKSTIITIAHTIQLMLLEPNIRILIASHKKQGGSEEFLRSIKHHFTRNEAFRSLFPDYCPQANSQGTIDWGTMEKVTLPNRTKGFPEATIETTGVTTDVTGRHYDVIKADDLVTRESVTNESMLEKTEEYNALLRFLFDQPEWGVLDYIGTPYHFADLYAKLREQASITKVIVPIIDAAGQSTFPERFSDEGIATLKQDPSMTSAVYSAQYLLNPIAADEQVFRPEWFKHPDFYYDRLPENLNHYIFVDPASTQRKTSDYTAIMHIGISEKNHIYVIDMLRDKLLDADRVRTVFKVAQKYGIQKVHYETIGFQSTDAYNIRRHGVETSYYMSVEEIKGSKASKEDRIRGLQYLFESAAIHFPRSYNYFSKFHQREVDMLDAFRKEAFMFPKCEHDDMLDCLSFVLGIRTHSASKVKVEQPDDEFNRVRALAIAAKPQQPRCKYPKLRSKSSFYSVKAVRSFR